MASVSKMPADSRIRSMKPLLLRMRVALKVQSPDIPHKTEAGAVALNVTGADRVRVAYENVLAAAKRYALTAQIDGVMV